MNDVLMAAILRAREEGDDATAGDLESMIGHPDQIRQLLAETRTESILESGFTGTVTDAAGRKQQYVDGVHVSGQHDTGGAGARTSHEQDTAAAAQQHDGASADEKGRFAKARDAIAAKLQKTAGGRAVLAMGKGGAYIFHKVERPLLYALHKTGELAVAAAKERGLSDEATAKLKRVLMTADFLGGYATGGAALAATGSVVAAKIAAVMPSASVAYLAYSTARNPLATWKAAKKVVADTFAKGTSVHESEQEETHLTPELAGQIAYRIGRSDVDSEWWVALYHAALAHTLGDAAKAVDLADAAVEAQPNGPEDE